MKPLIQWTDAGFYCEVGGFYIDPIKPVAKAVITHAHADHARPGHQHYFAHPFTVAFMRHRLGNGFHYEAVDYHQEIRIGAVTVSLYPSGHVPGGAQILVNYQDEKWLITGDYKLEADGISTPFETVACDVMVTESTFALPIFNWPPQERVHQAINEWWLSNQAENRPSLLSAYALGKAQRLLGQLSPEQGPIYAHGAIANMNEIYQEVGIQLPEVAKITPDLKAKDFEKALILTTPSAMGSNWGKRFKNASTAMASGWMQMRGNRRRKALDRGFVLSDHVDWKAILQAIEASGAERVYAYHGFGDVLTKYLSENGLPSAEIASLRL